MKIFNSRSVSLVLALTAASSLSGCLKTRAQLRETPEDSAPAASQPTKVEVQEVQNQDRYVIDEIKSEITRLNGRIEDLERANQEAHAKSSDTKQDDLKKLEQRIMELEKSQADMIEAIKKNEATAAPVDTGAFLDKAREQFKSKDYDGAIESLNAYLKNPKAKNAEEATFLRAESYHAIGKHKQAIIDYSKFPEKYTRSKYMPQALLKIGKSFEAMGMKEDAKAFYQELADKFPKSPEAKKVRGKY